MKIRPGDILLETYDNGSTTYLVLKTDITVPLVKNSLTESLGFKAFILRTTMMIQNIRGMNWPMR